MTLPTQARVVIVGGGGAAMGELVLSLALSGVFS